MKKTVWRFGIYGAVTICALFLLSWFIPNLDYSTQEIIGYIGIVVSLGFVFFGIKHFRDNENDGVIPFRKALTIGILITLIVALAFGMLDLVYVKILNPDFTTEYYDRMIEDLRQTVPPAEFEAKAAEIEGQREVFSNPLFSFLLMAFTVFIIGFIISLISALILQRK
ncbi:MAG: DUF4199 domain-containing protein [Flavobacteriaceae bacterium]|nr:DUF4199 domain-containing protein [Flavobacteriaceae bacterium]